MKPEKTSQWHLDYHIKTGVGGADDKLTAELHRTGKGVHVAVRGGIPPFGAEAMEQVFSALSATVGKIDGLDAEKPASHAEALRAIASYCEGVAGMLDQLA